MTARAMCPRQSRRAFLAGAAGLAAARVLPGATAAISPVREIRRGGMIYRQLGHTDLYVSLLSFGSHTDPRYKKKVENGNVLVEEGQARRDRLIASALDRGVNMVDTYENEGQWDPMARLVRGGRRNRVLVSLCRQFPMFAGENIDRAARLFGHVDLYRIYVGEGKAVDGKALADWDVMRKAKEAGKVRAIGIATHDERIMLSALKEFEGIDYFMFPYNFIHARADYSEFLPEAAKRGVGLIAIKPLAAGSIVKLDPKAKGGTHPERDFVQLYHATYRPLLPSVVAELTKTLERLPDESLCQAALRFVYSRPFMTAAMPGMFEEETLEDNFAGLKRQLELSREERSALDSAGRLAAAIGRSWLPGHYQWLDQRWQG
ncbi:MAG: aldo/keto reductase [Bryobacterales bacterium]|nr:aldo/keto reductase [Bryobacterales bacterium]